MKLEELYEGVWATPSTLEAARRLEKAMANPMTAKEAKDKIYNLVGDDDLFDLFDEVENDESDEDVRPTIRLHLGKWLKNLDQFTREWDPRSIKIIKKIVGKE